MGSMERWILVVALATLAGCIEESDDPATDNGGEDGGGVAADASTPGPDAADGTGRDVGPDEADASMPPPGPDVKPPCGNEDDLAPNQSRDDATTAEAGFLRDDLFLCPETEDWFRLDLAAGQALQVQMLVDPPETNLDVAITDAAGMPLAVGDAANGEESVDFRAPEDGTYYVRVYGAEDEAAFYALAFQSNCTMDADCGETGICDRLRGGCLPHEPAACGQDMFEPNDRDDAATGIAPPSQTEASLCGADRDWFAFAAEDGDSFDVLLGFEPGEDLDMFVVDAATGVTVAAATGDARFNPERLDLSFLPAGRYLVGVTLFVPEGEPDRSVDYRLQIAARSGQCAIDRDCQNDGLPICDDGICRAVEGDGTAGPGERCGSDRNCGGEAPACYTGGAGGHDNFCTGQCGDDGDCAAYGRGASCEPVRRNLAICIPGCGGDDDCSTFRTCVEGVCELRGECRVDGDCDDGDVCLSTDFGNFCSLPPPPPQCGGDMGFEPNERSGVATVVELDADGSASVEGLHICDGDDDWFRITVPEDKAAWLLTVAVEFREGVDIDLYLLDSAGNLVGASTSPDQTTEAIEARYIAPGDYLARVDQFASDALEDTEYSFSVSLVDNEDACTPEGNECGGTDPIRASCNADSGACEALNGDGAVELGGLCDSDDDCVGNADVCWIFEGGAQGWNICTVGCQSEDDCDAVPGTTCTPFQQFAVCLPPR